MLKNSIKYRSFSWLKFPINKKKYRVERKQSQKDLLENYKYINFQEFKIQMVAPELEALENFKNEFMEHFNNLNSKNQKLTRHGVQYIEFLYFLCKTLKPKNILETGVWLGSSTQIFFKTAELHHYETNVKSIDLPRLDLDKSYIYLIGLLVENKFKNNWELFIGKDRKYFKKILLKSNYDFYHFDSDKSYRGKKFLLKELTENKDSFIALFDDLSDNFFWQKEIVGKYPNLLFNNDGHFYGLVFSSENKYTEILGLFE